jgi:hypothetical protein
MKETLIFNSEEHKPKNKIRRVVDDVGLLFTSPSISGHIPGLPVSYSLHFQLDRIISGKIPIQDYSKFFSFYQKMLEKHLSNISISKEKRKEIFNGTSLIVNEIMMSKENGVDIFERLHLASKLVKINDNVIKEYNHGFDIRTVLPLMRESFFSAINLEDLLDYNPRIKITNTSSGNVTNHNATQVFKKIDSLDSIIKEKEFLEIATKGPLEKLVSFLPKTYGILDYSKDNRGRLATLCSNTDKDLNFLSNLTSFVKEYKNQYELALPVIEDIFMRVVLHQQMKSHIKNPLFNGEEKKLFIGSQVLSRVSKSTDKNLSDEILKEQDRYDLAIEDILRNIHKTTYSVIHNDLVSQNIIPSSKILRCKKFIDPNPRVGPELSDYLEINSINHRGIIDCKYSIEKYISKISSIEIKEGNIETDQSLISQIMYTGNLRYSSFLASINDNTNAWNKLYIAKSHYLN